MATTKTSGLTITQGSSREDFFLSLQSKYPCRSFAEFTLNVTDQDINRIHRAFEIPYVNFLDGSGKIKVLVMIEGLDRKGAEGNFLILRGYLKWNTRKWDNQEKSYQFSATFNAENRSGILTFC